MIKTKKQMLIVIGVFTLVMMLGTVTFAFFNYTRTGVANNIQVGRINFNTVQGPAINLNNAFPIDTEETGIMNDATKVGTVTINVTGDTSYEKGIEYLVKAVNVENTINNKSVPISIDVSYVANGQGKTIGTEDEEYFDKRGEDTSYYKVLATDTISDDSDILVGYIAPSSNGTGIDGNIVIKAYIDKANVAITDTYPEGDVTHTEGEEPNQETVVDYTNGTTSNWVGDRETFTTTEWNNLQQAGGISFQVKVEANEGTWVEENLTVNTMNTFPMVIYDEEANIKEVYFNKMGATRMQNAYDAATIKADLTYNNEGKVLAWLEENPDDNTKYNLIVASDGETYLTTGNSLFSNWSNVEKIEFNNINTSRVSNLSVMFMGCLKLSSLNLDNWDLTNISANSFGGAFASSGIKTISLRNWAPQNTMNYWLFGNGAASTVEAIDVTGWDLSNIDSLAFIFGGNSGNLKRIIGLDSWNTSNITNMYGMFAGARAIENLNLSSFDMSNVTNANDMFNSCSSLERLYVSDSWNVENVTDSSNMFDGCTSLVGQAPNTTYAFDSNDAIDKTYAKIATDNTKGYLTDISLKPTN